MFLHSIPFFRLTLSLSAGIVAGLYLDSDINPWFWAMLIIFMALSSRWLMRNRHLQLAGSAMLYLSQVMLGFTLTQHSFFSRHQGFFLQTGQVEGRFLSLRIEEPLTEKKNTWRAAASVLGAVSKNGEQQEVCGRLLIYWPKSSHPATPDLRYGDVILVPDLATEIPGAAFPEGFDFKSVMRYRNTGHQIFLTGGSYQKTGSSPVLLKQWAFDMREATVRRLHQLFPGPKAALMASLLIGYKDEVDQEDLKSFAVTGAMHVLAVSGMHVGLIYVALLLLFTGSWKTKKLKIWQGVAVLVLLWLYALVTGLSASVVRATLMFTLIEAGRSFLQRDGKTFNSLFAAAYLQLLISPLNLIDVGFQLSYLAVFGILYFYPVMNRIYQPPTRLLSMLWQLGLVSVAATLGTLPVSLYFFKSFPLWFIPVNMLVVPLSSLVIYMGIACLVLSSVPWLGAAVVWLTAACLDLMMWPMHFFASLPGASLTGFSFDLADAVLLGMAVAMLGMALNVSVAKRRWTSLAAVMLLFTLKQVWDFEKSQREREIIVCELKGQLIAALREGRSLYMLSQPLSASRADSLLFYTRDYRQKNHIRTTEWLIADTGVVNAGGYGLRGNEGVTRVYRGNSCLATIAWWPDSVRLLHEQSPVFTRYRHRRYAGLNRNIHLLRNNFRLVDAE